MSIFKTIFHSPLLIALLFWSSFSFLPQAYGAGTATASLGETNGVVDVLLAKDQKVVRGRDGFLLYMGDLIRTSRNGATTVYFRDGSEIRVFENTDLLIEESKELQSEERSFQHKLLMKIGSIWGKFVKGQQKAEIQTSVAIIGVKGTILRVHDDGEAVGVSVVEGKVTVKNENSTATLTAGKRLQPFGATDDLEKKVDDIPFRIRLTADRYQLDLDRQPEQVVRFNAQVVELAKNKGVQRRGRLRFQSTYSNLEFPEQVRLNRKGFVRFPVRIKSPAPDDNKFDGKIVIWAVMDGSQFDNVGAGNVLLTVKMPHKRTQIQIDANSGSISPIE